MYVYSIVTVFITLSLYCFLDIEVISVTNLLLLPLSFILLSIMLNKDFVLIENSISTSITIPISLPAIVFLDPLLAGLYGVITEFFMINRSRKSLIKMVFNVSATGLVVMLLAILAQKGFAVSEFNIISPTYFLYIIVLGMMYSVLSNGLPFIAMLLQNQRFDSQSISAFSATLKTSSITIFLGLINVFVYHHFGIIGMSITTFLMIFVKPTIHFRYILNNEMATFTQFVLHVIKLYDPITHSHSERVKNWTVMIGKEMKLSNKEIHELSQAASWHDIGKIEIPNELINKAGKLTEEEFDIIKSHPEKGFLLVKDMHFFKKYLPVIRYHHERMDGKGYPLGLKGKEIPLHARIMCVADSFDAMTSRRSYKQGMSMAEAVEELKRCSGTQFDPAIVEVFIRALQKEYGIHFEGWDKQVSNF